MQGCTRDSLGFAVKSTYCEVNGKEIEIFKDPKTVVGMPKKSLKGLIQVVTENGTFVAKDQVTKMEESVGWLNTIFKDSKLRREVTLNDIRKVRNMCYD